MGIFKHFEHILKRRYRKVFRYCDPRAKEVTDEKTWSKYCFDGLKHTDKLCWIKANSLFQWGIERDQYAKYVQIWIGRQPTDFIQWTWKNLSVHVNYLERKEREKKGKKQTTLTAMNKYFAAFKTVSADSLSIMYTRFFHIYWINPSGIAPFYIGRTLHIDFNVFLGVNCRMQDGIIITCCWRKPLQWT